MLMPKSMQGSGSFPTAWQPSASLSQMLSFHPLSGIASGRSEVRIRVVTRIPVNGMWDSTFEVDRMPAPPVGSIETKANKKETQQKVEDDRYPEVNRIVRNADRAPVLRYQRGSA